jgi:hypothetical protein
LTLGLTILASNFSRADEAIELVDPPCPLRVKRVGFVMSALGPAYLQQQTFPDSVGTSRLGQ